MGGQKQAIYEQILVIRCRGGDRAALEELIGLWERRLFYYIRRLVDQEADAWDVLQRTWVKVVRGIRSLRDPRSLRCWLYTLARNTAIDSHRARAHRELPWNGSEEKPERHCHGDPALSLENAEAVHHALAGLAPPHREVLTLYFLQDLTIDEIAQVIGVKVGTVKSRLHYARAALRQALQEEDRP